MLEKGVTFGENIHALILPKAFRATYLIRRNSKDHRACLGKRRMVKCRCFSILMPPFQCWRGFDLELVSGAQKPSNLASAVRLCTVAPQCCNSCGFHPQWKVVALIFSAARLPGLLEEICWQFAAGLPAFSSLPLFWNSDPNLSAKLAPFSDPRQGPKKGSLSFFSRQCPNRGRVLGPRPT